MNHTFLKALNGIWQQHGLLSESANLDFTTLPHWGDATHLENNWSGTRNKSLTSLLAVLAQDPDTGLITYGDTTLRHQTKNKVVLEFVDFYHTHHNHTLNYLIFDSKFTTYEQLKQLDELPNPLSSLLSVVEANESLTNSMPFPNLRGKRHESKPPMGVIAHSKSMNKPFFCRLWKGHSATRHRWDRAD